MPEHETRSAGNQIASPLGEQSSVSFRDGFCILLTFSAKACAGQMIDFAFRAVVGLPSVVASSIAEVGTLVKERAKEGSKADLHSRRTRLVIAKREEALVPG